ncbi:Phytosulfokine receptor 1 [Apostasia shenzhenica]|uniref:non-specific serine/threonine protein kinase n=1 Tax=Apostasia shenzhenica TaxID=1088818 RepID=A0A2I0A9D3_9ASPA|nr:Phytosulfokine receptor 1 [Apostasia shenzhenica]
MGNRESLWTHACCLCFSLVLLPASKAGDQNQACHAGDLAALRKFAGGLEFPVHGWSANASSDCCGWDGVQCGSSSESGQRVIRLDLANRGLEGHVSDSLEALDKLEVLNLSNNSLKGVVPSGVFQFQHLKLLDFSKNEFTGEIPANSSLESIQVFNVSGNNFVGSHPTLPGSKNLLLFDISYNLFSGGINSSICNNFPAVQVLSFSMNSFSGELPLGFGYCSSLRELSLAINEISGYLPEDIFSLSSLSKLYLEENQLSGRLSDRISNLSNLVDLDLSFNKFIGNIPNVLGKMKKLECFSAQSNRFWGALPSFSSNLSEIRVVNIRNNSLSGVINLNFSAMDHLSSLDLASNSFQGFIPEDLSKCLELKTLNLANNFFRGEIPESFKNLVSLSYLSLSKNLLSNIAEALGVLQHCPNLTSLVLTNNFHGGEAIPIDGIQGFPQIEVLVIPYCGLSGSIPSWLKNCTKLKVLDLSWNDITGSIPLWLGDLNNLFYLDLSNNSITGEIPDSLSQMKGMQSNLHQPNSLNDFPFFIKKNSSVKGLQYNQISSFPPSLILSNNKLVGPIPKSLGNLSALHQLDLSFNRLNGSIPGELSDMSSLESLDLAHNNLTGTIPSSLTNLTFLSQFSVAFNNLVGSVPTGGQFSTFSATDFEGNSGLCFFRSCSSSEPTEPTGRKGKNKAVIIGMAIGIGLGTIFLLAVIYLFVLKTRSRTKEDRLKQVADSNEHLENAGSKLVILFQDKEKQNQLTISDILKSTGNFDQGKIIGCGGFGLVYRAILPDESQVAIKRLSGEYGQMEREFQAEVEALSRAQHRNLVLLQGYCKIGNDRLLIYSYMENGSLDYWLHERSDYGTSLNWSKRLKIAQGAARGLAYLHLSCQPHILHRDIKSSNILLDGNFEAHLADFGLARLILPYNTHVTTDLVGTLGYIPPEYGQTSVATYKGDVYSFGVVLLELLTGKRPIDMTKPKSGRDLISWVLQMRKERREYEVFDSFIYSKEHEDQMTKMLDIACFCLSESPKSRPSTQQLVTWLDDIGQDCYLMNTEQ